MGLVDWTDLSRDKEERYVVFDMIMNLVVA